MRTEALDKAVGDRVRTLREAAKRSRDDLARACQRAGLRWDAGRVAHLEQGRVAATLPNLIGVAQALTELAGRGVTLAELLPAEGVVEFNDGRRMRAAGLRAALAGQPVERPAAPEIGTISDPTLEPGWGKADDKLVADLGLDAYAVRAATQELFGRTATQERDARAGAEATPQKRGRVTRAIVAEVANLLGANSDEQL